MRTFRDDIFGGLFALALAAFHFALFNIVL